MKVDTTMLIDKTVAVALSGGVDSVVLLHVLYTLKGSVGFRLKAIHVEHGIRGEESVEDMNYCARLCESMGIPLTCERYSMEEYRDLGDTLEQSAREIRYRTFERLVEEGYCDLVATAHHLGDNSETVLMRIFRGTGISGLGGISASRGTYVRPLLEVSREEIEAYATENHLAYRTDSTNEDTSYTRNFIRHEILPKVRERYPQVDEAIRRLSVLSSEDDEYLYTLATSLVRVESSATFVNYVGAPKPLLKRAVRIAFASIGVSVDIEDRHLAIIIDAIDSAKPMTLDMPYQTKVSIEGDRLAVYRPISKDEREITLEGEGLYRIGGYDIVLSRVESMIDGGLYIDGDAIEGAVLRTRREGDIFKPFGSGRKKLKDYLIDKKIPLRLRDNLPLIARDREVLAIATHEISDDVKITDATTLIYRVQIL